ncbi:uncharacterized protein LOC124803362 [Schistocerca piceifrons]|uniref:uncharacterized protein LOC124803362 n=1 Tax=Schistocerca piceifrons TaxID=274613 RepID=UPI001F5F8024|nr:uncharacterized protein LOC124803362 [Schistocerca piceifrons]
MSVQQHASLSKAMSKQCAKSDQLNHGRTVVKSDKAHRTIVNLSNQKLDDGSISALSKGLKFSPAPRHLSILDIISGIEQCNRNLSHNGAEDVRLTTSHILVKAKPPESNISQEERRCLRLLRENEDLVVLPADKGNATVVLNSADYHLKMLHF